MAFFSKKFEINDYFIKGFCSNLVCFKDVCKKNFKVYTILAQIEMLDKTIADERLIIRRRAVSFESIFSRPADESLRLIFAKQPAQV